MIWKSTKLTRPKTHDIILIRRFLPDIFRLLQDLQNFNMLAAWVLVSGLQHLLTLGPHNIVEKPAVKPKLPELPSKGTKPSSAKDASRPGSAKLWVWTIKKMVLENKFYQINICKLVMQLLWRYVPDVHVQHITHENTLIIRYNGYGYIGFRIYRTYLCPHFFKISHISDSSHERSGIYEVYCIYSWKKSYPKNRYQKLGL